MLHEEFYDVHTYWGWFRLDEGAYRDYLAGKLWINWIPGKPNPSVDPDHNTQALPPDVTEEAVRLRDVAAKRDTCLFLREHFPGAEVEIPYRDRMKEIPIEEMSLTVRSSNGLMRAGAKTFGALRELMLRENGLRSVRNLGQKSEQEILHNFFNACYAMLRPGEQAVFWQRVLDEKDDSIELRLLIVRANRMCFGKDANSNLAYDYISIQNCRDIWSGNSVYKIRHLLVAIPLSGHRLVVDRQKDQIPIGCLILLKYKQASCRGHLARRRGRLATRGGPPAGGRSLLPLP